MADDSLYYSAPPPGLEWWQRNMPQWLGGGQPLPPRSPLNTDVLGNGAPPPQRGLTPAQLGELAAMEQMANPMAPPQAQPRVAPAVDPAAAALAIAQSAQAAPAAAPPPQQVIAQDSGIDQPAPPKKSARAAGGARTPAPAGPAAVAPQAMMESIMPTAAPAPAAPALGQVAAAVQPPPPKPPANQLEKEQLKSGWMNWLTNPAVQSFFTQFGINMLQPRMPGQTVGGATAQALGSGLEAATRSQEMQRKAGLAEREQTLKETSETRRAEQAERGLGIQERGVGIQERGLGVQERRATTEERSVDAQIAQAKQGFDLNVRKLDEEIRSNKSREGIAASHNELLKSQNEMANAIKNSQIEVNKIGKFGEVWGRATTMATSKRTDPVTGESYSGVDIPKVYENFNAIAPQVGLNPVNMPQGPAGPTPQMQAVVEQMKARHADGADAVLSMPDDQFKQWMADPYKRQLLELYAGPEVVKVREQHGTRRK